MFLAFLNCLNPVSGSSLTAPSDQSVPVHVQVAVPSLYALPGFKSSIDLGSFVGALSNVFAPVGAGAFGFGCAGAGAC